MMPKASKMKNDLPENNFYFTWSFLEWLHSRAQEGLKTGHT